MFLIILFIPHKIKLGFSGHMLFSDATKRHKCFQFLSRHDGAKKWDLDMLFTTTVVYSEGMHNVLFCDEVSL